jgi:hypothetical protein
MPPHYSRDLAHGPGVGSGLWPQLQPPTCSRRVSGVVGLGPFCYVASLPRSPGPYLSDQALATCPPRYLVLDWDLKYVLSFTENS